MLCLRCGHDNRAAAKFCEECAWRLDTPTDEAPGLDLLASSNFVGRKREMGELLAALTDALEGRGRLVMLVGEPGIGKTRIAQELAAISEERGAQVLWGRCYEGEGAPPYWPWVQPIREYIQDTEPGHIDFVMGAGAADVAEIVPQLRQKLPDLQPPPSLEPEAARFRLFDSITTFLKKAAETQPLVLILDNLHWADRTSLLLLEFLAPELERSHILVLGTYRDVDVSRHHPLSQTLGNLIREHMFQRVQLRGMTLEEVGRFIEITAETSVPAEIVDAVHSRTEGNPLFVTEVVRLLKQEEFEKSESWDVRIPEGIRDAIGRRLSTLSEECNQVLTTASVVGREFSIQQLGRLAYGPHSTGSDRGQSEDELLGIMDEAAKAYVIEEVEDGIGLYRFTHALIQQTLASELSTTLRVRTHALIAEVLEELYGDSSEAHAEELAHHYYEAAGMTGPKMVHYSRLAGEQALATYAYEEALNHFQRALGAKEGQSTDAETASLLFGLGRAQVATLERHRMQEAHVSLSRAFEFYADVGDVDRAVAVAESYPVPPVAAVGVTPLIAKALALVAPDSREAGRLLSRYGNALGVQEANYEAARDAFDDALSIAQHEGDAGLEVRTLVDAGRVDGMHLHWRESLVKTLRAIELLDQVDDPSSEVPARMWATQALLILGDLQGAKAHASAALAPAERLRHRVWLTVACWSIGPVAVMEGDWEAAREFINRGLAVDPSAMIFHGLRALIEYEVGDFRQGEVYLEEMLELLRQAPIDDVARAEFQAVIIPMIARISGNRHRPRSCQECRRACPLQPVYSPSSSYVMPHHIGTCGGGTRRHQGSA